METLLLLGICAALGWLAYRLIRRRRPKKSLGEDGTGWWYLKAGKAVGPVHIETLREVLIHLPEAASTQVWRSGLADWMLAREVPSLMGAAERPPPIITTPSDRTPTVGALVALAAGAGTLLIYSSIIYGNSADGIARLAGQFFGAAFLLWIIRLVFIRRHAKYSTAAIFGIAALSLATSNAAKLGDALEAREAQAALQGGSTDARTVADVAHRHPSNKILQFFASAFAAAEEANAAANKLYDEIEPPILAQDINPATATRVQIRAYLAGLRTAEENATQLVPRVRAISAKKRESVNTLAKKIGVSDDVQSNFLVGLDATAAKEAAQLERQSAARIDLYHALAANFALLMEHFGRYQALPDGRVQFADAAASGAYSANSRAAQAAAEDVQRLFEQGKQSQRTSFVFP
jgi:hypothetical protein